MSVTAWIIVGIIIAVLLWGIISYNQLVTMRQPCNQAFANIDVQLKQRHDLVPNLVETVKGYAGHERGTFDAVVHARNAAVAAQGTAAKAAAESVLGAALRKLFALAEAYPNLKANANFQRLQADLGLIENNLADARRAFNSMVQGYNTMIQRFPTTLFAGALGFAPHDFFNLGEERRTSEQPPHVKF
jgi:LemA protein